MVVKKLLIIVLYCTNQMPAVGSKKVKPLSGNERGFVLFKLKCLDGLDGASVFVFANLTECEKFAT